MQFSVCRSGRFPGVELSHFEPQEWADFIRFRAPGELVSRMRDHLESVCMTCMRRLEIWRAIAEVAAGPSRDPDLAVARLIFPPSDEVPAPWGRRHAPSARQHFLFQKGNLLLDMHVEPAAGGAISMAGQIMDPVTPTMEFSERLVTLVSGTNELTSTATNQFGEFHLEFEPVDELTLVLHLADQTVLVTPLPSFVRSDTYSGESFSAE
jgi:hypothetical protein